MFTKKVMLVGTMLLALAGGAMANTFRASDTVYVPVAGKVSGANNSFFRTDIFISNLSQDRVVVDVAFGPTNEPDNSAVINTGNTVRLQPALAPGERREIVDIMGSVFGRSDSQFTLGHLIFFGCKEGGVCTATSLSDVRPISVEGRIYTTAGDGATFGQLIPGIPFYLQAGLENSTNLQSIFITGIRNTAQFRTNIGLVNGSSTNTTVLRVRIFNSANQQIDSVTKTLGKLGHTQFLVPTLTGFGYVIIDQVSVDPPVSADNAASFFAYGSMLDNKSNDPTYLEPQFLFGINEDALCVFQSKPPKRAAGRR